LNVQEGESFKVQLKIEPLKGNALPDRVYLVSDDGTYLMNKNSNSALYYVFDNLNNDIRFHFKAINDISNTIIIDVVKRTSIGHLSVALDFPNYLERPNETIDNPGDLVVPYGTKLIWNGVTKNTKSMDVVLPDTSLLFDNQSGFRFSHHAYRSSD